MSSRIRLAIWDPLADSARESILHKACYVEWCDSSPNIALCCGDPLTGHSGIVRLTGSGDFAISQSVRANYGICNRLDMPVVAVARAASATAAAAAAQTRDRPNELENERT